MHRTPVVSRRGACEIWQCSLAALHAFVLLLVEAGNEVAQVHVLDHGLEHGVSMDLDVFNLDLGAVGDEVHLALTFLL